MPVSFPCGDAHTSNQPISNKIYNQLRKSAYKDQKRKQRHNEAKEKSTAEKAVDENTRIILQKGKFQYDILSPKGQRCPLANAVHRFLLK